MPEILISQDRLLELLNKEAVLNALLISGVDTWEGYEEALDGVSEDDISLVESEAYFSGAAKLFRF